MAQDTSIYLAADTWTQLTDADATSITFQNVGNSHIRVKGAATASAPTSLAGALRYNPGQGERNVALSDLFPGITAARVYAYAEAATEVVVSHG